MAVLAAGVTPGGAGEPETSSAAMVTPASPILVLVTNEGLVPASIRVPAGTPVVWLNRTRSAAIAITFEAVILEGPAPCEARRAFHTVPGYGPFTMLMPPGQVASICAPEVAGSYPYQVSGDLSFRGRVEVESR